jgi:hypothetical protein
MSEDILNELNKFKDTYYSENKKNNIFNKKEQKYDVAKEILTKFDINLLLQKTAFIIPKTNKIFVNYQIFKQFACPDNYEIFVKYIQNKIPFLINQYGSFECHIDIDTFTISAAERYKGVIEVFCRDVFEITFTDYLNHIYIYNVPTMIDKIAKILLKLIDKETKDKIVLVNKEDSNRIVPEFKKHAYRTEL